MSTFTTHVATTQAAASDPTRHVNYNVGMVLGVDDFNQEFAYLSGRDQWMARDLIGYGTVSGLRVITENDVKGPRVVVAPGVALSPRGQLIRVPAAQCAYLNDWLDLETTRDELLARVVSPPSIVRAYVVLCYRECPTEKVPIPGEPCRSEDDIMLPSRLVDDFRLELVLDPPGQREEDAVRDFVNWLREVPIDEATASTPLEDFLDAIRAAAHLLTSPPAAGSAALNDYMFGSPSGALVINNADLCEYLDAAFRLWVTELRPRWRADFFAGMHGCSGPASASSGDIEECLLLAEVDVPVIVPDGGTDLQVEDPDALLVDESRRPILVHLRMLQEMLLCGRRDHFVSSPPSGGGGPSTLAGDVTGPAAATTVERIRGVVVDPAAPAQDQVLTFRAGQWGPAPLPGAAAPINPSNAVTGEQTFGLASNGGASADYSRADHTHGTPPDPIPPHQADPAAHTLAGDVTAAIGVTRVARIQGVAVDPVAPAANQVFQFRTGQWRPTTLAAAPAAGTTVAAALTFGLVSNAGTSPAFSRTDHTHGTPLDPIPPHRADPAAHTLAGDVTGTIGGTTVASIRNRAVVGTPTDGQVLTFRNNQWRPETVSAGPGATDVVDHPPGLPRYSIVAAGIVLCNGSSRRPPVYNGLNARASGSGQVSVRFNGATRPDGNLQYIVKVLPVFSERFDSLSISFIQFLADGFQLRITRAGQAIPAAELEELELMIEVSRFEGPGVS